MIGRDAYEDGRDAALDGNGAIDVGGFDDGVLDAAEGAVEGDRVALPSVVGVGGVGEGRTAVAGDEDVRRSSISISGRKTQRSRM